MWAICRESFSQPNCPASVDLRPAWHGMSSPPLATNVHKNAELVTAPNHWESVENETQNSTEAMYKPTLI